MLVMPLKHISIYKSSVAITFPKRLETIMKIFKKAAFAALVMSTGSLIDGGGV